MPQKSCLQRRETVGAALCGRPCVEFKLQAATEDSLSRHSLFFVINTSFTPLTPTQGRPWRAALQLRPVEGMTFEAEALLKMGQPSCLTEVSFFRGRRVRRFSIVASVVEFFAWNVQESAGFLLNCRAYPFGFTQNSVLVSFVLQPTKFQNLEDFVCINREAKIGTHVIFFDQLGCICVGYRER